MESAVFGLVGVVLGGLLTGFTEWLFQHNKRVSDSKYLAILVATELDRFVVRCADVVGDDGRSEGPHDSEEYPKKKVEAPTFDPLKLEVEWKSLPVDLMYEILDFPYKTEVVGRHISGAFQHAFSPPDLDDSFEERQLQHAILGLAAAQLVRKLRKHVGMPARPVSEWNPQDYMEERKAAIERRRTELARRRSALGA